MGFRDFLKETIWRADLLSASPTFRTRKQPVYETLTGGVMSIIVMSLFCYFLFVQMSSMLNNLKIQHNQGVDDNVHATSAISSFPFAVAIQGVDLSINPRKFIIELWQHRTLNYSGGAPVQNVTRIALNKCNYSDWSQYGLAVQHQYNSFGFDKMLCIQKGQNISLAGYAGSEVFEYLQLDIHECNQTVDGNCDTQANIDAYMTSYLSTNDFFKTKIFVMDTIVSAGNKNAISHFLEKNIFLAFSKTIGTIGHINMGEFDVFTDESLFPFSHNQKESGVYIEHFASNAVSLANTRFIHFNVYRSTRVFQVSRTLGKVDSVLSYVGGLFSLLFTAISFFFGSYSQHKYELYVAESTLTNNGKSAKASNINFFTYLKYVCYDWFDAFGCTPSFCPQRKHIHEIRQQSCQQLDPSFMLKRIKHVQDVSKVLINQHKQMCLYLSEPYTIEQSKKMRNTLSYYDQVIRQMSEQNLLPDRQNQKKSSKNAVMNECLDNESNCSLNKNIKKIEQVKQQKNQSDNKSIEKNILNAVCYLQNDNSDVAQNIKMKIGQNILEYIKLTRQFQVPSQILQESKQYKEIDCKSPHPPEESDFETIIRFQSLKSKPVIHVKKHNENFS